MTDPADTALGFARWLQNVEIGLIGEDVDLAVLHAQWMRDNGAACTCDECEAKIAADAPDLVNDLHATSCSLYPGNVVTSRPAPPTDNRRRVRQAPEQLRGIAEDIDAGRVVGGCAAAILRLIASDVEDDATAPAAPLVAAGPNPDMDEAWRADFAEYLRLTNIADATADLDEEGRLREAAEEFAYAVIGGLAERATAGDVPGLPSAGAPPAAGAHRPVYVVEVLGRMDGTYVFADPAEADRFAGCFLQGQVWAGELPVLTTADGVIAAEQQE